jgi:enoyl-CoA hydratase/carnithine racemase
MPSWPTSIGCSFGYSASPPEALAAGIVDELVPEDEVLDRAVVLASEPAGKNREVIAEHKRLMYGPALTTCGLPGP